MTTLPEYVPFPSIPRLFRACTVTEKIDGTNAQVYVSDDLEIVAAGSRNRWITVEDDNYGFARWVAEHRDELRKLGPGHHAGEWWGSGIQRGYGLKERRFSLFNVSRWHEVGAAPYAAEPVDPRQPAKWSVASPACCNVVPVLYRGDFDLRKIDGELDELTLNGSKAAPGYHAPEGLVVYHEAAGVLFKATLGGDGHKGAKR